MANERRAKGRRRPYRPSNGGLLRLYFHLLANRRAKRLRTAEEAVPNGEGWRRVVSFLPFIPMHQHEG
jgi:hypothetical protein